MSRFARITEDPEYEDDFDEYEESNGWAEVDTAPLSTIVDGWVRDTVAKKPQSETEVPYFGA